MSERPIKFTPTLKPQNGYKVQIPHTQEGKDFLDKLHALLGATTPLPFVQSCPPEGEKPRTEGSTGSTTYALDIRLEQEGWPP